MEKTKKFSREEEYHTSGLLNFELKLFARSPPRESTSSSEQELNQLIEHWHPALGDGPN